MKILTKLSLAFLFISLISLLMISVPAYFLTKSALTQQFFNHLTSVSTIQEHRVSAIIAQNLERLELVASRTQLRLSLASFVDEPGRPHQERMNRILQDALLGVSDFRSISILTRSGQIVASTRVTSIGTGNSEQEFFVRGLRESSADIFFLDDTQQLGVYLSGPLYLDGNLLGVIVIESEVDNIIDLVSDYSGLGETGETFLAKRDADGNALFLAPLRFDKQAALSRIVKKEEVNVPMTQALLKNEQLFTNSVDYRGEPVLAATRYIEQTDWGLVVKIDEAEALAPVMQIRNLLGLVIMLSSSTVLIISLYLARTIVQPIINLTNVASTISAGELSQRAEDGGSDEISLLAQAFNRMATTLIEDIAARKQTEAALTQYTINLKAQNAELDAFAHTVAHDLKSPLGVILSFAELLGDYTDELDESAHTYLQYILEYTDKMNSIIEALLLLAEVRKREIKQELLDMQMIVTEAEKRQHQLALVKEAQIIQPKAWPTAYGYAPWIEEVWANYLSNAIKYGGEQPRIEVGATPLNGMVRFWVKDEGPGIEASDKARLFTPFTLLKNTKGHGLGLSIVQRIIQKCGGEVGVESQLGQGSTFWFTLPAASCESQDRR